MKQLIKKIFRYALIGVLTLFTLVNLDIKSEAAWGGPSSVGPYVQQDSEMRAVWVATVSNLNIKPQAGNSEAAIKQWQGYYLDILDNAESNNLNTIIFQIRPNNDAFYPSKYNPWSEFLIPNGTDPGWDPVKWMIEVTHERGMEYHAWLNPYRTSTDKLAMSLTTADPVSGIESVTDVDQNELNAYKERYFANLKANNPNIDNPALKSGEELHHNVVLGTEGKFVLNPASKQVQTHINNTIAEIIDNYDIDGIHFDDYFYPNDAAYKGSIEEYIGRTYSSEPYYDQLDYNNYIAECGKQGIDAKNVYDWRRDNVNQLISGLGDLIREKNSKKEVKCAFGISPAARWAPKVEVCTSEPYRGAEGGMSGGCNNYYSYSDLYADTYKWAKEGWIDYIVPQNYTNLKGEYNDVMKWWSDALTGYPCKLYVGTALYQVTSTWGEGVLEMYYQLLNNQSKNYRIDGYVLYSYKSLTTSIGKNAMSPIVKSAWKYDNLTPLYEAYTYEKTVQRKSIIKYVSLEEDTATIKFSKGEGAKAYAVYRSEKGNTPTFEITDLVSREINPKQSMTFKFDLNTYDYYLVTIDNDNTIYNDYQFIDLTKSGEYEILHNITYNLDGGLNPSDAPTNYAEGKGLSSLPIPTKEYYSFLGWFIGDEKITSISADEFEDITLNAKWERKTHKVTYNPNGGSLDNLVDEYLEGEGIEKLPVPTREGYKFLGWFIGNNIKETILPSDKSDYILTAKWEKIIEVTTILDKNEYSLNDEAKLNINITDIDNGTYGISVLLVANITKVIYDGTITSNKEIIFNIPEGLTQNGKLVITISEGSNKTIKEIELNIIFDKPNINLTLDKEEYYLDESGVLTINIDDKDSTKFTVSAYYSNDGVNYNIALANSVSTGKAHTINFDISEISTNSKIKVIVSDGINNVEKLIDVKISNKKPELFIDNISSIKTSEKINIVVTTEDHEKDQLTYKVYLTLDGKIYQEINSGEVNGGVIILEHVINEASDNANIKVEVSDGMNTSTILSNNFKVEQVKKGCGCGKSNAMFEILAIITLLAFVLRKKDK